mgnify:CR=1 FL=1
MYQTDKRTGAALQGYGGGAVVTREYAESIARMDMPPML